MAFFGEGLALVCEENSLPIGVPLCAYIIIIVPVEPQWTWNQAGWKRDYLYMRIKCKTVFDGDVFLQHREKLPEQSQEAGNLSAPPERSTASTLAVSRDSSAG